MPIYFEIKKSLMEDFGVKFNDNNLNSFNKELCVYVPRGDAEINI